MSLITLASATDIARWAATRASQDRMPELLRRLVYATTEAPTYVDFPSGDAVQSGGYDGATELSEDHPNVPRGLSVWESGANAKVKTKADEDYDKRTDNPPPTARGPVLPVETTFVFVTPRRWVAKAKWAKTRRDEMKWRDVRVLDADDLEAWLQQAPATHVWLSRLIGVLPSEADDVQTIWADWSEAMTPSATTALILAGRDDEVAKVQQWLTETGRGALTVSAESTDDAIGVISGIIASLPEPERTRVLSRCVVVSTRDAFVQLASSREPLILIPTYAAGTEVQRATRNGHRVLIPSGAVIADEGATTVIIPRIHRRPAEVALIRMGLTEDRARELAGIGRRSMLTLRRRLATNPLRQLPAWAAPGEGASLVPMLLLGQFDESRQADLQALASLSTTELAPMRQTLLRWAQEVDPPVRHVGNTWYLVSKEDAWALLSRHVSREDLERFVRVASNVLGEIHPKFDLPQEERWAASIHGKDRQYSSTIAEGIADTLGLLGALDVSVVVQGGVSPSRVANRIVDEVLRTVGGDWRGWATLSDVLPRFAEAAPDVFLNAVETQIANDESAVTALFRDDGDVLFTSSAHTGLLWALEVVAWSPEHLARSARILATLDRLDPGGRSSNRPGNSCRSIFLGWFPQTSANLEIRLKVLAQLRTQEPAAAWRLLVNLLPRSHDHSMNNPRPKWRDWVVEGAGTGATYHDIFTQTSAIIGWMVADAGDDPERWSTLIKAVDNVGPEEFSIITEQLERRLRKDPPDEFCAPVFDSLRELLSHHRSFPDAAWALSGDRIEKIEPLFIAATPNNTYLRLRWLFSTRPQMPEGREADWDEHERILFEKQQDAAKELYAEFGTRGMLDLAKQVERPDELGRVVAFAGLVPPEEEERLIDDLMDAAERTTYAFGRGFANGWTGRVGDEAALAAIEQRARPWSDITRGRLLLSHRPNRRILDIADNLSSEGQAAFWGGMYPFWLDDDVIERGLRGLLNHHRYHTFVDAAALHLRKYPALDPELIAQGLQVAPTQRADPDGTQITAYDVGVLLDGLEKAVSESRFEEGRLAQLEFVYLPILGHFERPPRILHQAMAKDPGLFVEAVRMAYRGRGEEKSELGAEVIRRGEYAYRLLDSWRIPPGSTQTGFDVGTMNDWVNKARTALHASGRLDIGDEVIGMVMSGSGTDSDGAWPAIPIRDLIECLKSDHFEQGLMVGLFNSRGVITRDPLGGGNLERGQAASYERMAQITATRWVRTSAMLRLIAGQALAHAAHEDIESELLQDLEG